MVDQVNIMTVDGRPGEYNDSRS